MIKLTELIGELNEGTELGTVKSTVRGDNAKQASSKVSFKTGAYGGGESPTVMLMSFAFNDDHIYLTKDDAQKVVATLIKFIKGR